MKEMLDKTFRLNPIFSIKPVEELTERQKTSFRRVLSGKNVHSLLHAPGVANLSVKALNRELAEFLDHLREPKRLSDFPLKFGGEYDKEMHQLIVQLVLDGVLEVRSDGGFVSGMEALNRVISPSRARGTGRDKARDRNYTCEISGTALDFALISPYRHPRDIAWILYNFNRIPMHRQHRRLLPDEESVMRFLELDEKGCWSGMDDTIRPIPPDRTGDGDYTAFFQIWQSWRIGRKKKGKEALGYKVYFSSLPEDTPAVFKIVRDNLADSAAHAMKTGRVASAMLRPDKLIVYFRTIDGAMAFAERLVKDTSPFKGQGVPFTYQLDPGNTLISIGVDPPGRFGIENSWRRYVTDKLALAIQGAHRAKSEDQLGYIRTYMNMSGVDIEEWRPVNRDWTMEFDLNTE